jgi:hypothetical protein
MEKTIDIEPDVGTILSKLEKEQHEIKIDLIIEKLSNLALDQQKIRNNIIFIETIIPRNGDITNLKIEIIKRTLQLYLGIICLNVATIGIVVSFLGK